MKTTKVTEDGFFKWKNAIVNEAFFLLSKNGYPAAKWTCKAVKRKDNSNRFTVETKKINDTKPNHFRFYGTP